MLATNRLCLLALFLRGHLSSPDSGVNSVKQVGLALPPGTGEVASVKANSSHPWSTPAPGTEEDWANACSLWLTWHRLSGPPGPSFSRTRWRPRPFDGVH